MLHIRTQAPISGNQSGKKHGGATHHCKMIEEGATNKSATAIPVIVFTSFQFPRLQRQRRLWNWAYSCCWKEWLWVHVYTSTCLLLLVNWKWLPDICAPCSFFPPHSRKFLLMARLKDNCHHIVASIFDLFDQETIVRIVATSSYYTKPRNAL